MVFFALTIFVSSCSDDFTEENALLLQGDLLDQKLRTEAELAAAAAAQAAAAAAAQAAQTNQNSREFQLLLDSLARLGGIINYSVNVVPAGSASFGLGATNNNKTDVAGIRVIASQNGASYEAVTDAGGIANFPNLRIGNVAVTVLGSAVNHTDLRFVANMSVAGTSNTFTDYSKITRNAASRVAIFPVGDSPLAATLNGKITWESDLTNDEREVAPAGLPILARLNVNATTFKDRYFNTTVNGMNGVNLGGTIISMAYDPAVANGTVVGTEGLYQITGAPASLDGLDLELIISEFSADQSLLIDELNDRPYPLFNVLDSAEVVRVAAQGKKASLRTLFGTSVTAPSAIPVVSAAFARVSPPTQNGAVPGVGAGAATPATFAAVTNVAAEGSVTFPLASAAVNGGGAYLLDSAANPTATITGGNGVGAAVSPVMTTILQGINVTGGSGYTTAPTVSITGGGGTGAQATASISTSVSGVTVTPVASPGVPTTFTGFGSGNIPTITFVAGSPTTATGTINLSATGSVQGTLNALITTSNSALITTGPASLQDASTGWRGGVYHTNEAYLETGGRIISFTPSAGATLVGGAATYTAVATASNNGTGATFTISRDAAGAIILPITIVNRGTLYPAGATLTIDGSVIGGVTSTDDLTITVNTVTSGGPSALDNAIGGIGFSGNPVIAATGTLSTGTFTVNARTAGWITDNGGSGLGVNVLFTVSTVTPAATIDANTYNRKIEVTNISITAAGTGYSATNAPTLAIDMSSLLGLDVIHAAITNPVVVANFVNAQPTGAAVPAIFSSVLRLNRTVAGVTITNPGLYSSVPGAPTVANGGNYGYAQVTNSTVTSFTVANVGAGYDGPSNPPVVTLSGGGSGLGFTPATATVAFAKTVAAWTVTNPGVGYTQYPTVTVSGGTLAPNGSAAGAPTLTFGTGRVTSASITNAGSGLPAGVYRGSIAIGASTVGSGLSTVAATFGFTVAAGQLATVSIVNGGSWPAFAAGLLTVTNGNKTITIERQTNAGSAGAPGVPGSVVGTQAIVALTIDATTGRITAATSNGGAGYTGTPTVHVFSSVPGMGTGATISAPTTAALLAALNGSAAPLTVTNGGSGYFGRNYPMGAVALGLGAGVPVSFTGATAASTVTVVSGSSHAKDIYLGTGKR